MYHCYQDTDCGLKKEEMNKLIMLNAILLLSLPFKFKSKYFRKLEAEQSYKYALRVGLKDADLLGEIKSTQKEVGFGDAGF